MDDEDFFSWLRRRRHPFFTDPFRGFFDLNEYFREMDKMFEEMIRQIEGKVPRELVREKRLTDGRIVREMGPFVYGYTMTIGPDGKPRIREFGNVRPSLSPRPSLEVTDKREPIVDIIDEDKKIKVIAEMPGLEKEDINLNYEGKRLILSAERGERKYYKEIELTSEVDPEQSKATYRNGILEVILTKKEDKKGHRVRIE
ncbi:MAG: archaeal heat shock protein Hsp20 [Nitrososphaerales archaeon]